MILYLSHHTYPRDLYTVLQTISPARECEAGHQGRFLPADLVLTALVFHIQHSDAPLMCIRYERTAMFRNPSSGGISLALSTHMWRQLEGEHAASPAYPWLPAGIRAQYPLIHTQAFQASHHLDHRRSKTHVSGVVGQTSQLGCSMAGRVRRLHILLSYYNHISISSEVGQAVLCSSISSSLVMDSTRVNHDIEV